MDKNIAKNRAHLKRKKRVRKKILGTSERPRLCVYRSLNHVYAQVIDDVKGVTLVSASSILPEIRTASSEDDKKGVAKKVGELVAERALAQGISQIAFDRGGYRYHGRVRSLAEGARGKGLNF